MLKSVSLFNLLVDNATETASAPTGGNLLGALLPMILILGVMYFFMIRPQKKKDKAVKDMLNALKVGDRVLTIGGIYGTITGLHDDQVIIAVGAQKTTIHMARWAIKSVEDAPLENDAAPEV